MHEYTVELRILGVDLNPSAITRELGLEPSTVRNVGDTIGSKCITRAEWGFNGSESNIVPIWESLEDGLTFVLGKLANVGSTLAQYRESFEMVWWCGHYQSSFDGGPTLSAGLLRTLGEFGAPLFIDNYFSDTPENQPSPDPPST